jgi:LPS export ABC transporter protein LptC
MIGLLGLLSCRNKIEDIQSLSGTGSSEDKAQDVTIIYSSGGKVEARLYAKEFIRADKARPPYTDARSGVRIEIFDSSLKIQSTVTARYARWYETKGNVLLRDQVRVRNNKGEELQTEELIWSEANKKFFTEKAVRINMPTQSFYGTGLEADQNFSNYKILQPRGVVPVDKGQVPE